MVERDLQLSGQCLQLRNMLRFLMTSIDEENKYTREDIYEFLKRAHNLSAHICKKIER